MVDKTPEKQILPKAPTTQDLGQVVRWGGDLTRTLADNLSSIARKANDEATFVPTADLNMLGFSVINANILAGKSVFLQSTPNTILTFNNLTSNKAGQLTVNTAGDEYQIYDSTAPTGLIWATTPTANLLNGTYTGTVIRMQLDTTGLLTLPAGQIAFPATQNVSAGANVLDDYEKLTYTPALTFGGAAVGMTYTRRGGWYTKVGNLVVGGFELLLSAKGSSTGVATVSIPFTSDATASHYSSNVVWSVSMTGLTAPLQQLIPNASAIMQIGQSGAAGVTQSTDTIFTNTSRLGGGFAFHV